MEICSAGVRRAAGSGKGGLGKVLTGRIFDIQGFSVHDGPGIRTTVFFKGCPLRCAWCHSPESQEFPAELNWMEIKCAGVERCGKCIAACPAGAISPAGTRRDTLTDEDITLVRVDRAKCVGCFKCAEVCVHKALYVCGKEYTVDELTERIVKDRPFYEESGGGVTFSGGECLWQPEFLLEVLKRCRAEGVHTAVDTTGYVNRRFLEPTVPYTDLYLYDIKQMDSELHKRLTGVPNELILENARFLASAGAKLQIRIPVIPLFNDDEASFEAAGKFILELGDAVEVVQLLPYHNLGVVKWARLGRDTPVFEATPPSDELMQARKAQLIEMGLRVVIH